MQPPPLQQRFFHIPDNISIPWQMWFTLISDLWADKIVSVTDDYTSSLSDRTILCDASLGNITVTLLEAVKCKGKRYTIKKTDVSANTVTIDANGTETIDDALTIVLTDRYESVTLECSGTAWWIV